MLASRVVASRRLAVPGIVLCTTLLACGDDPVEPSPVPTEKAVAVTYCAPAAPTWVAFRDADGSWTRELPATSGSRTTFRHVFTTERAAMASLTPIIDGQFTLLRVLYAAPEELGSESDTTVASCVVEGGKTLRGSVSGLDMTQLAIVSVGPSARTGVQPQLGLDFAVEGVPSGPQDLFAARTTNGPAPTRLILRRGIDLPNGSLIPGLDFESSEAFDVVMANLAIENLGGEPAVNLTGLITPHGNFQIPILGTGAGTTQRYATLPADKLLVGDLEQLHVSTGGPTFRTADVFFRLPDDRTLVLGAPMALPSITAVASGTTLRPRARFEPQSDYDRLTTVVYDQPARPAFVVASMTPSYAARSGGYDIEFPDLSAVPGFDPAWALQPGLIITWTASRIGGTLPLGRNAVPVNGATRRTVSVQDTITLP